ncbi:MAG: hypothetical protein DRP63_01955 [Planctomycetota bacterium]|nr:MAG: hypothetical protein DRP63_01955 [Planctomycetota bacterium]
MREEIDRLMEERGIEALVVMGRPTTCRDMAYLCGPVKITGGYVVKPRGADAFVVVNLMERDEAAQSGLKVRLLSEFGWEEVVKEKGSRVAATVEILCRILEPFSPNRVAFYGQGAFGDVVALAESLKEAPFEAVFEQSSASVLTLARMRKDEDEIARIKDVGRRAQEVFARVVQFLSSCSSNREGVLTKDGEVVTVGRMKRLIRMWSEELDLDASAEEVIFAQGYDAAVPHSRGTDSDSIKVGETIVFDFCPCERGGGYFFDMTRTFCVGEVRDEVALVWRRVLEVQTRVLSELEVGRAACEFDQISSSMFEEWGYPTLRKNPGTSSGYVHGLGHGLGLQIHEMPYLSALRADKTPLAAGHVFTVEPGLYFPDKRFGVRLEDVVAIHGDGTIENLTPFSKEILVPLKGRRVKTA